MPHKIVTTDDLGRIFCLKRDSSSRPAYLQLLSVDERPVAPKVRVKFQGADGFVFEPRSPEDNYPQIMVGYFPLEELSAKPPMLYSSPMDGFGLYVGEIRDITEELDQHPECLLGREG